MRSPAVKGEGREHFNVDTFPKRKQAMYPDQWLRWGAGGCSFRRDRQLHCEAHGGPGAGFCQRQ